jgi:hypothetical protein
MLCKPEPHANPLCALLLEAANRRLKSKRNAQSEPIQLDAA